MTAEDRAAHVEREAVAGVLAAHRVNYHHRNVGPEPVTAENLRYTSCDGCDWLGGMRDEAGWEQHVADAVLAALPQTGDAAAVARVEALADELDADGDTALNVILGGPSYVVYRLRRALAAGTDQ